MVRRADRPRWQVHAAVRCGLARPAALPNSFGGREVPAASTGEHYCQTVAQRPRGPAALRVARGSTLSLSLVANLARAGPTTFRCNWAADEIEWPLRCSLSDRCRCRDSRKGKTGASKCECSVDVGPADMLFYYFGSVSPPMRAAPYERIPRHRNTRARSSAAARVPRRMRVRGAEGSGSIPSPRLGT